MLLSSDCIRIPKMSRGSTMTITVEGAPRPKQVRQLLALILGQAMLDGATRVSFGVASDQAVSMRYWLDNQWFEMVAPPPECFAPLFQLVVATAEWNTSLPMQGRLPVKRGSQCIEVSVTLTGQDAFELSWVSSACDS